MIHFNTPEGSKERQETKPLTLEEEKEVIDLINGMMHGQWILDKDQKQLIQRFVNHYQNLNHHMVSTCGLYACDSADLKSNPNFFKIEF